MVDVVIVGGGPAGITAGVALQRRGYRTCIIDCQTFPREKLCAGVLTVKSVERIQYVFKGLELENLDIKSINKISLLYNRKIIGTYITKNAYSVINRKEFDFKLLQYYKSVGGQVFEGEKNYHIVYDKNYIMLSDGKKIKYNYLIGADGINSRVRQYVQNNWKAAILCFEKFIPNEANEDHIRIDFGRRLGGYSWRIPSKERIGIGLGEFYVKGMKRTPRKYNQYFKRQNVDDISDIRGAFVSYGRYVKRPIKRNVILVGDAAGLVDAMTGEGIYFAIESGLQAAVAIINCETKENELSDYLKRIKRIHNRMREQSIYNKLFYVPVIQLWCLRYVRKNPDFVISVLDNTISSYRTWYTQEIWKNTKKRYKNIN